MRILVTGGTGFLGSAFVRTAQRSGHELAVLTRSGRAPAEGIRIFSGSVTESPWREIERFAPDAGVHAAWIATPGVYLDSSMNQDWLVWSTAFLSRLASIGTGHLTVLGTCTEYRITGGKLDEETTPLAPGSPYACAKCELHRKLRGEAASEVRLPASTKLAWARLFYPYGSGEHPARLASSLIAKLRLGEPVALKTPQSTKDYIHVDDVASALLAVVERQFDGSINIGTGEGVKVETVARELGRLLERPELIFVPANAPADPLDFVLANATRLRSLGWRPQVPLAAGLRRLVEASAS